MSSEDSPDDTDPYLGTRAGNTTPGRPRANASLPEPIRSFATEPGRVDLGMWSVHQMPTVWSAVNYPRENEFEFDSFYLRYIRQSEAQAIIDKPANDTWQSDPIVHDEAHQDSDEPQSEFERKVKAFFEGEYTRRKPIHRLNVLDRMSRLGEYAILVIGFGDGRDLKTPVGGVSDQQVLDPENISEADVENSSVSVPDNISEPEFDSLDDLMYLAVFGQDRVEDIDVENQMTSERFRLPKEFTVITQDNEEDLEEASNDDTTRTTETIHWTRVIHTPEGTLEDDLRGTPALKSVFHELLNIDKIKAASGEGFWRAGYQGLHISPPKDRQGKPMEFDDDGEGVHEEIQDFIQNMDRSLATPAEIDSIDSQVHDPMPHLKANYQSISAAKDIPKSILTGEDRADTASSEDVRQWHQKIGQRRNNFAEPVILEPLIQRLIDAGVFPEPEGEGFTVEWQPLDEPTMKDEWEVRKLVSETLNNLTAGKPTMMATVPELRSAIDWTPEVGNEVAPQFRQSDADAETDLQVDEEQQRNLDTNDESAATDSYRYDSPAEAKDKAEQLGIDGYHVERDAETDSVYYVPGDDEGELEAALSTQSTPEAPA